MKRKPVLPPAYLFGAIVLIVVLHFLLPINRLIPPLYNLLGLVPLFVGTLVNIHASNSFKKAGTTVKPFEPSSTLVTNGPYRFSRHPMYLGMTLILAGLAVLLGSVTPVLVVPVFAWLMDRRFIVAEEQALEETFGEAYLEYKRHVRRWI